MAQSSQACAIKFFRLPIQGDCTQPVYCESTCIVPGNCLVIGRFGEDQLTLCHSTKLTVQVMKFQKLYSGSGII